MVEHVYHDLWVHASWHTKGNRSILKDDLDQAVYQFLRQRCAQTKGVYLHGIGGIETHVHVALSYDPNHKICDLLRALKGASSHEINRLKQYQPLYWQRGYGAVSFGRRNLRFILDYIAKQKEHHANGTTHERLERTEGDDHADWKKEQEDEDGDENG